MSAPAGPTFLASALAGEYAAMYAYGVVGAQCAPDRRAAARAAWAAHRSQRDWLRGQLAEAGAEVPPPAAAYEVAHAQTPEAAAALAVSVELPLVPLWADVAGVTLGEKRLFANSAAQGCAARAVSWGAPTAAFPGIVDSASASPSTGSTPSKPPRGG